MLSYPDNHNVSSAAEEVLAIRSVASWNKSVTNRILFSPSFKISIAHVGVCYHDQKVDHSRDRENVVKRPDKQENGYSCIKRINKIDKV